MKGFFLKRMEKISKNFENPTYAFRYIENDNGFYFQFMYDEYYTALSGKIKLNTGIKSVLEYQVPKQQEKYVNFKITNGDELQNVFSTLEKELEKLSHSS